MKRFLQKRMIGFILVVLFIVATVTALMITSHAYYVGSRRSNIYHYPNCYWAQQISYNNYRSFSTVSEAKSYGYKRCHVCYPPSYDSIITKIQLNSPPQNMHVGDISGFSWTYWPGDAIDTDITFTSSNTDVAIISGGYVYATGIGSTVITASSPNNVKYSYTLKVVPIYSESVTIINKVSEMLVFDSHQLSAQVVPSNVTDKTIKWSSTNNKVATINDGGKIKAISEGTVTIKATNGYKSDSFKLIVKKTPVKELHVTNPPENLYSSQNHKLKCTISPQNATYKDVVYSSDNQKIATIDRTGNIVAKAEGKCNIIVKCDGITKKIPISVQAIKVSISNKVNNMILFESHQLSADIFPSTDNNKTVTWSSSDNSIVTIDDMGKMHAVAEGTCTISAANGNYNDSFTVKVARIPVIEIIVENPQNSFYINENYTLNCSTLPGNATFKEVFYSSDNPEIISIDEKGRIVAKAAGECNLIIKCDDKTKELPVSVYYVKSQEVKTDDIFIVRDDTIKDINIEILPSNATNGTYIFWTEDEEIAEIQDDKIEAKRFGITKLHIKTYDGVEKIVPLIVHNIVIDILLVLTTILIGSFLVYIPVRITKKIRGKR